VNGPPTAFPPFDAACGSWQPQWMAADPAADTATPVGKAAMDRHVERPSSAGRGPVRLHGEGRSRIYFLVPK